MAIDVCSEISSPGLLSPRISFSHDLKECGDAVPVEEDDRSRRERLDRSLLDSDFDFCVGGASSFVLELSSADELFSDGKILPGEIRRDRVVTADRNNCRRIPSSRPPPPPSGTPISSAAFTEKKSLKELLSDSFDDDDDDDEGDEKPPPKPFWQFKRSSSLNCDVAKSRGLIRSLQFLSRSNSTGSVPNPKDKFAAKDNPRQNLQKQPSISSRRSPSSESYQSSFGMPFSYGPPPQSQKPPTTTMKKRYGPGVRVNPVLNFQPHITIGTVSLFGLGSLFCNGKVRKKKK